MVKVRQADPYETLDQLVRDAARTHSLKLQVDGWTRKTYDIYLVHEREFRDTHLARIESLATTSGEIRYFDDRALPFCEDLGGRIEAAFHIEATLIKERAPGS